MREQGGIATMDETERAASIKSKRGRPSAQRSAAIDCAIRDAAMDAFLADGFEGTAMETVAQRAGVPKTTLYKRFPDKRGLLRAVLTERVSSWCLSQHPNEPGTDLETRLKRLATDILHQATTPEVQAFWSLVLTAWSTPAQAQERHEVIGYTRMVDCLEQEIREYGPPDGIVARDPRSVAIALMAMLGGWIEYVAPTTSDPEKAASQFAATAVGLLMRGASAW